jgi:hypothetical protein
MSKFALTSFCCFLYFTEDFGNIDEPELVNLLKISCFISSTSVIDFNVFSDSSCSSSTSSCSTLINVSFRPISPIESSLSLATSSTSAFHSFSPTLILSQAPGLSPPPPPLPTIIETIDDPVLERINEEIWADAISQYLPQLEEEEDEKHNEDSEIHLHRSLKRKHE